MTRKELAKENAALKSENTALCEQLQVLLERVRELKGRQAKNSHNGSKPPSSDGLRRRRRRSDPAALEAVSAGHSLSLQPPC
jgi:Family of unknown function (DUF6444)